MSHFSPFIPNGIEMNISLLRSHWDQKKFHLPVETVILVLFNCLMLKSRSRVIFVQVRRLARRVFCTVATQWKANWLVATESFLNNLIVFSTLQNSLMIIVRYFHALFFEVMSISFCMKVKECSSWCISSPGRIFWSVMAGVEIIGNDVALWLSHANLATVII